MDNIIIFLIYVLASVITLPFMATLFVYIVSKKLYKHTWKAIHTAVNWTTIFYMISVATILSIFFNRSFIAMICLFLVLTLSIIITIQWKLKMEVILSHGVKILWRISFITFAFTYICLVVFGIIHQLLFV